MSLDSTNLVVIFEALLTLALLIELLLRSNLVRRFSREVPDSASFPASADDVFGGSGDLLKLAHRFVRALRIADSSRALGQFDIEARSAPLRSALASSGSLARSAAGLFVIAGLVVTLFNLQGAVSGLGQTFQELSKPAQHAAQSADVDVVKRVQDAMASVASRASTAFRLSGFAIFCALLLMIFGLMVQTQARRSWRRFEAWANDVVAARVEEVQGAGATELQPDFTETIRHFRYLIDSFDALSKGFNALDEFRHDIGEAVSAIKDAVDRLPGAIQANMSSLSSQVTREIAEDLKHQYDILQRLLAAYGDLGLNVKVIEKFTQDVLKQHGEAAAALVKLGSLPADVRNLSSTSDNLTVAVSVLNKKTDEMALLDIKSTRKDLDLVADRLFESRTPSGS